MKKAASSKDEKKGKKEKKIRSITKIKENATAIKFNDELASICSNFLQTLSQAKTIKNITASIENFCIELVTRIESSTQQKPILLEERIIENIIFILEGIISKIAYIVDDNSYQEPKKIGLALLNLIEFLRNNSEAKYGNNRQKFDDCLSAVQKFNFLRLYQMIIQGLLAQERNPSEDALKIVEQYLQKYKQEFYKIRNVLPNQAQATDYYYIIYYGARAYIAACRGNAALAAKYIALAEPSLFRMLEQGTPAGTMLNDATFIICENLIAKSEKENLIQALYHAENGKISQEECKKIYSQKLIETDNNQSRTRKAKISFDIHAERAAKFDEYILTSKGKLFDINLAEFAKFAPNSIILSYLPYKEIHAIKCSLPDQCDKELLAKCLNTNHILFHFENDLLVLPDFYATDLVLLQSAFHEYVSLLKQTAEQVQYPKPIKDAAAPSTLPEIAVTAQTTGPETASTYDIIAATLGRSAPKNRIDKTTASASATTEESEIASTAQLQTDISPKTIVFSDGRIYEKPSHTSSAKFDENNYHQQVFKLKSNNNHVVANQYICIKEKFFEKKKVSEFAQKRLWETLSSGKVLFNNSRGKVGVLLIKGSNGEKIAKVKDYSKGHRFEGPLIDDSNGNSLYMINSYKRKHPK